MEVYRAEPAYVFIGLVFKPTEEISQVLVFCPFERLGYEIEDMVNVTKPLDLAAIRVEQV